MKDIKDILDHYSEQPSEEVWERLNARLDAEMPVQQPRKSAWKWAAVTATVIAVSGGVLFGVMRHQSNNEEITAMNVTEKTVEAQPQEADVPEVETLHETSPQEEEPSTTVETNVRAAQREEEPPANVETRNRVAQPAETQAPAPATKEVPKTNVRQEVLPPNSTLAKQLAADPVLRNLTEGGVEWTKPAHLSIPNLFTPNGDGVNDYFVIEGLEQYTDPNLVIRDKSGRIVYQSNHYRNSWDGGNCPDGVYSYEFTFAYNGIENQAVGKVRIMRS
ncbi:MAG: gliding motility-associated C-terminal domain-containing protein [Bacteroidales bacterium]|nr:gliding motility-associated C-terminal domain-containing protein [Bacteroidales bacterium]